MGSGKKPAILMAASEALPYSKSGGLGDVMGSLPFHLSELGLPVRVVIPFYHPAGEQGNPVGKVISSLNKAASKGMVHKKTASRRISRLTKRTNKVLTA